MAKKIYRTKTGQPYIKLASGRAKFVKRTSARKFRVRAASSPKTKTKRRVPTMARKTRKFSTYGTRSNMAGWLRAAIFGYAYGTVRAPLSGFAAKIPVIGNFSDEVALIGLGVLGQKFIRNATARRFMNTIITVEAHNLARMSSGNILSGLLGATNGSVV